MAKPTSVRITVLKSHRFPPLPKVLKGKLKRAIELVLSGEKQPANISLSIVLCDDATIHDLNRRFLNHDYPTDVLSFLLADDTLSSERFVPAKEQVWGEIIVSVETAHCQARRYRQTLEEELVRLTIHGLLHLLGYDDATPEQRRKMRRKERFYLKQVFARENSRGCDAERTLMRLQ